MRRMDFKLYDTRTITEKDYKSTQVIRAMDIFIYGPVLIMFAFMSSFPRWVRVTLITMAVLTIVYNAYYYLYYKNREQTIVK